MGDFGQALFISWYHEDAILTGKSRNCAGTAFVQGDSADGSKLTEQTLKQISYTVKFTQDLPLIDREQFCLGLKRWLRQT